MNNPHEGRNVARLVALAFLLPDHLGKKRWLTPLALGERFKNDIPGSEMIVLDKCGHVPQLEKPADSTQLCFRF
jgi:pimeloyl-ACP methyl ester carboxylesterase